MGTGTRRASVGYKPTGISGGDKVLPIPIQADNAITHSAGDSELRTLPSRDGDVGGNSKCSF